MFMLVVLPCFDLCRSNSSHVHSCVRVCVRMYVRMHVLLSCIKNEVNCIK